MPTSVQMLILLLVLSLVVGGLSAAHHIRKRTVHGREREAEPLPPADRADL